MSDVGEVFSVVSEDDCEEEEVSFVLCEEDCEDASFVLCEEDCEEVITEDPLHSRQIRKNLCIRKFLQLCDAAG